MLEIKFLDNDKEKNAVNFIIETLKQSKFSDKAIVEFLWINYVENNNNINISTIIDALEERSNIKHILLLKCMKIAENQFV